MNRRRNACDPATLRGICSHKLVMKMYDDPQNMPAPDEDWDGYDTSGDLNDRAPNEYHTERADLDEEDDL